MSEDLEARLMAIAFNAVREAAYAKTRDSQYTDNDAKTALAIRKLLDQISGYSDDAYQPMQLAPKNQDPVNPVVDKVYNMLENDIGSEIVDRKSAALAIRKKT